jgi:lytic murein transglycosylase
MRVAMLLGALLTALPAHADTSCRGGQSFDAWLGAFRDVAARAGISASTLAALDGVSPDERVLNRDRSQPSLSQSFLDFLDNVVTADRLERGRALLEKHRETFARIERDYGVPGPVIVAFWGLETDYGAFTGDFSSLRSLATLAYDCRRPDQFRAELLAALQILDRGDLAPDDMVGAWAGEVGQMQFVPTYYLALAVDYDGDGRRNLVRSVPDVLASSANLLKHHGWQAGQPWLEEVRMTADLPWPEADLTIRHPRSQWATWGVTYADGRALPADDMPASLLLPMGRLGPAFLAYENFGVYTQWNQSLVYATTAAYFAMRLAGAPRVTPGNAVALTRDQIMDVQQRLQALGHDVGGVDGTLGARTRAAVKAVQMQLGLPADSYPDAAFISALRQM